MQTTYKRFWRVSKRRTFPVDPRLHASLGRIESDVAERHLESRDYWHEKDEGGLTIFIPNYNHRLFLPRALRSALDATGILERKGIEAEILVIDDASRDGSQRLLRDVQALYSEARLKVICMERNFGQATLWNVALWASEYRYVLRLDADNELLPENLPTFIRAIKGTGAAMVYGNLINIENGAPSSLVSHMPATFELMRFNYIDAFSIVDAPRIVELGGVRRIHPYTPEDRELVLHLIAEEQIIVFVPVILGYYHRHAGSASKELNLTISGKEALRRVYAQTGLRDWDSERTGRIYHPDVGYVDEWWGDA